MPTSLSTPHNVTITSTVPPDQVYRRLKTIDVGLLDQIAFLSRHRRNETRAKSCYATPGRAWLASRLRVSVRTVSRHVSALVHSNLLDRTQRRPVGGKWQTNLYRLKGRAAWLVARTMQAFRRPPTAGHARLTSTPQKGRSDPEPGGRSALRAAIQTLEAKLGRKT